MRGGKDPCCESPLGEVMMMMEKMVDGGCQCRSEDDDGGNWPWYD